IFLTKYRPKFPVIAVTPELSLYYRLAVEWGVYPMLTRKETDRMVWRREACIYGIEQGILSNYDKVLVLSRGAFMKETNNLTLTVVNDILTSSAAN
ncbi:pyruvate kinase alpha/beta domain-containing protein, partial [Chlamydia pecorum]|uniref:pyruvate kinase alpha/beta domain-containing protein n=1 Tax=Chlamydia pecorum TaxID=85991 RepID=UPI0038906CA0